MNNILLYSILNDHVRVTLHNCVFVSCLCPIILMCIYIYIFIFKKLSVDCERVIGLPGIILSRVDH